ncbi:coiled-coil domain-containing protein 68 isoform X2 [Protopterus annectens]|nr:coiled-coil domain-containing protein 68 isoform X2 [Protopterus annectens]
MLSASCDAMGKKEPTKDGSALLYGATTNQIKEETEYIKKIRCTLEKVRNQVFGDDTKSQVTVDAKICEPETKNIQTFINPSTDVIGCENHDNTSHCNHSDTKEIKSQDHQLLEIHKENQELRIKIEASQEAGASSIRDAARKLYENYHRQAEELKKLHEEEANRMQSCASEQEQKLRDSVEHFNQVAAKAQEKQNRITALENLVERMEKEKNELEGKKQYIEEEIKRGAINSQPVEENLKSSKILKMEVSTLQEKILHLQNMISSQQKKLRNAIHQIQQLNDELKQQDDVIWTLTQRVEVLEAKNKELKKKVEDWSNQPKKKFSRAVATMTIGSSLTESKTPYAMLMDRHEKKS